MASPFFLEIRFLVCISVEIIFSLAITCRFYRFILKWRYQLGIKYQKEEDFIMDIDVLKKCGKNVTYKRGQVICQEGEIGHSMFILLQGNADITINSFSDQAQNLGTLQEGSFFGEMSLLEGKPRSATIVALSDEVIVLEIAEENFPMLLLNASSITFRILLTLNNRLNAMLDRIEEDDKKFVFKYKRNPIYNTIQKLDVRSFHNISQKDPDYVLELLKYLSSSLEKLNREYIHQLETK